MEENVSKKITEINDLFGKLQIVSELSDSSLIFSCSSVIRVSGVSEKEFDTIIESLEKDWGNSYNYEFEIGGLSSDDSITVKILWEI